MKQVFSDNRIVILIGIVGFTGGIWGIHTHAFEGDDLAYLQGSTLARPVADLVFLEPVTTSLPNHQRATTSSLWGFTL